MPDASPKTAAMLTRANIFITTIGLFVALYFAFDDLLMATYVVTFVMVGVVGILGFLRHSVFYKSDQARMGWHQDRPEFQIEVGFSNLSVAIAGILVVVLDLGYLACAIPLLVFGTYLACAAGLNLHGAIREKKNPGKVVPIIIIAGSLLSFAFIALWQSGAV